MKLNLKEIESVVGLSPLDRYKYFLKKVADNEFLYTLKSIDGNFAISIVDSKALIPFWSSTEFVDLCKINGWEDFEIIELTLEDLEDEVFDFIATNDCLINIFPVKDKSGFVVNIDEFARDLNDELSRYD